MPGLSDIHLFTSWDSENNPIKMRMAESLKLAAETSDDPFSFRPSSVPQCGTISMKLDQEQWDNAINTLKEQSDLLELRKYKAEEFWIQSYGFVEEVFESVRLEWQLPLYQAFLKEVNDD